MRLPPFFAATLPACVLTCALATLGVTVSLGAASAQAQTTAGYNALADLGMANTQDQLAAPAALPKRIGESSDTATSTQTNAQLLAYAPHGVSPGKTIWLGLRIAHAPNWHTYWKNSGDSGLPTTLRWQLPAGWQLGELAWPTPKKFPLGPLANYGFDGTVLLTTPVVLPAQLDTPPGSSFDVGLQADWLACKTECIPEDATLALTLPSNAQLTSHAPLFDDAFARVPKPIRAQAVVTPTADSTTWRVAGLPAQWVGQPVELFPETTGLVAPGAPWTQAWDTRSDQAVWTAQVPQHAFRSDSPTHIDTVLALAQQDKGLPSAAGVRIQVALEGEWPAVKALTTVSPALQTALDAAQSQATNTTSAAPVSTATLLLTLGAALLGGLLLNLMPCVFPVLALKVLAFARPTQHTRSGLSGHQRAGLAYTAGVVVSFVALGGVLLTLRAAGEALGWGFQLQNPMVVSALAVLFTLIALNLLGVFEFGAMLPQSLLNARAKSPSTDAFLSGVLATAVASPCTAPFMGASLGLAIVWPTAQALAVFAALGVGMAAPYLLASWVPSVANLLPKPGAWMVTFKTLMAFPMLATVVWLMWVVGQQTSMNGAAALMLLLVMLAFAVWAWQQGHSARTSRTWRMVGAALLAISAWSLWGPMTQTSFATAGNSSHTASSTALWQTWTPTAVQERLDNGQTVFVDFTAAWCVTCQVNELTTLASEPVLTAFKTNNIALLKADWTKRDPAITQALNDLQRSGVPTYAVYSPGRAPLVLTEILSHAVVIAAVTQ